MPEPDWPRSNRWLTVVLITPEEFGANREQVRLALEGEEIESRPVWKPMHMQPVFNCKLATDTHRNTQTISRPSEMRPRETRDKKVSPRLNKGKTDLTGHRLAASSTGAVNCAVVNELHRAGKKAQKTQREGRNTQNSKPKMRIDIRQRLLGERWRKICLPSGTAMTNSDLDRVIETILKCKK